MPQRRQAKPEDDLPFPQEIAVTDEEPDEPDELQPEHVSLSPEQLEAILNHQRDLTFRQIEEITGTRGQPLQPDYPTIRDIPFEGLPNPAEDFHAFQKAYMARAAEEVQRVVRETVDRSRQETLGAVDDRMLLQRADTMLVEAAPDIPKAILDLAAKEVADSYRAQKRDPLSLIRADMEGITQEVLDRADDMMDDIRGGSEASGRTATLPARPNSNPKGDHRGRQTKLGGNRDEESLGSLVSELQTIQKRARLY